MSAPSERPLRAHDHASFALDPPAKSVDQPPSPEAPRTAAELVEFLRGLPSSEEGARVHRFIEAAPWREDFFKARDRNLIPHGDNNASSVTALIERVASAYFDADMRAAGSQEIGQLFKLTVAIDDDRRCREYGGLVHNFIILLQETRDWILETGAGIGRLAERPTHTPYGAVSRKRFLDDALARSAEEIQDKLLPLMRAEGYGRYMAHCKRLGLDFTDPEVMSELRDFAVYPDADWLSLTLDRMMDAVERHDRESPPEPHGRPPIESSTFTATSENELQQTALIDSADVSPPERPTLTLRGPDEDPIVNGRTKSRLTPGQYRVVKALLDAHPDRLGKDALARRASVEGPVNMIDRLRRDEDWAAVLDKPGRAHGGYGLRV